jgi:hypothetical protein
LKAFGGVEALSASFWKSHKKYVEYAFQKLVGSWPGQTNVNVLAGPMKELHLYFDHISELKWESEKLKIMLQGEALVHRYFRFLLEQNFDVDELDVESIKKGGDDSKIEENKLTPFDWFLILDSILLLSYNQHFCEKFGQIKSEFNFRLQLAFKQMNDPLPCHACGKVCLPVFTGFKCEPCFVIYVDSIPASWCVGCRSKNNYDSATNNFPCCPQFTYRKKARSLSCLQRKYDTRDNLVPLLSEVHARWAHVHIPKFLSDENHFGHMPYEFCRLMKRMPRSKYGTY